MSVMFEVICQAPIDCKLESYVLSVVSAHGGTLDYREEPDQSGSCSMVLTYEFQDYDQAFAAATRLRGAGLKIDGPYDYSD